MTAIAHAALIRDISRRLELASLDELRVLDKSLTGLEQLRSHRWERVISAPGMTKFCSIGKIERGSVVTRCAGRWPITETVETQNPPRISDMCRACLRWIAFELGAGHSIDALIAIAGEIAKEDVERAELRAQALAEMETDQQETAREHRLALDQAESRRIGGGT